MIRRWLLVLVTLVLAVVAWPALAQDVPDAVPKLPQQPVEEIPKPKFAADDKKPAPAPPPPASAPASTSGAPEPFGSRLFTGAFLTTREDGLNPDYVVAP